MATKLPPGFSRDFGGREAPAIGVFGSEGSGKSRFCATACEWAAENGKVPGFLVFDRKTRMTVRKVCEEMGFELPLINEKDFVTQAQALEVAVLDRESEKDNAKIQKLYSDAFKEIIAAAIRLGDDASIEPIVVETGSALWDHISFAHFGRKQGVGKSRVWGPPKQDWTDLIDALSHKTLVLTFWERDEYKGDDRTGFTKADGPPHLGYSVTTMIRLNKGKPAKNADPFDRFSLDLTQCQENVALEGQSGLLTGEAITYSNLMALIRP